MILSPNEINRQRARDAVRRPDIPSTYVGLSRRRCQRCGQHKPTAGGTRRGRAFICVDCRSKND